MVGLGTPTPMSVNHIQSHFAKQGQCLWVFSARNFALSAKPGTRCIPDFICSACFVTAMGQSGDIIRPNPLSFVVFSAPGALIRTTLT